MGIESLLGCFKIEWLALFSAVGGEGWIIYFHRWVLEMELSFGFYGEGRRDCSRLVPEAGKNKLPANLITGLLLGVLNRQGDVVMTEI